MAWFPNITHNGLRMLLLDYGALVLFGLSISVTPKREFKNYNIFLILLMSVIVSLCGGIKVYPINFIHIVAGCLLYIAIVRNAEDTKSIIKLMFYFCLINLGMFFLQISGINLLYLNEGGMERLLKYSGFIGRSYHLAYILSFMSLLVLSFNLIGGIILILLACFVSFYLKCYAAMFTIAVGLSILIFLKFKKSNMIIGLPISFCLLTGLFLFSSQRQVVIAKFQARRPAVEYVLRESLVNPLVGYGIGSFERDINLFGETPKFQGSFNQYFRFFYEFGILPCLFMAWGIIRYFKRFKKYNPYYLSSLATMAVFPLFHEVLRFSYLAILIIVVAALFEIDCIENN